MLETFHFALFAGQFGGGGALDETLDIYTTTC